MKKFFFLFTFSVCFAVTCSAQYYQLGLRLTKGNTYYYLTTASVSVTQIINDKRIVSNTNVAGRIAFTVTGIRDSLYDMSVKYESLLLKMEMQGGTVSYSSERTNLADPASAVFAAFKNQPFNVTMSRSGNLTGVKGTSAIIENIINANSNLTDEQKARIGSIMMQTFGESAFKSNFEMGTAIFPSVTVKKGVVWSSDSQLAGASTALVHTVYDLRDITETFYQIHAASTIAYPDRDTYKPVNGMQVRNNQDGFMTADIVVDKLTGWLKQSTISQTIKGNTEIKDSPKVPGGKIIPMEMHADITITDIH